MLLVSAGFLIQWEPVQRSLRSYVIEKLETELQTQVSIGHISWTLFTGVTVDDALIYDQKNDTLFYIGKTNASLQFYDGDAHHVRFRNVELDRVKVNFRQYSGEKDFNFDFFFSYFDKGPRDTTRAPVIWTLFFKEVKLANATFRYRIDDDTVTGRNFRENDFLLENINGAFEQFYVVDDSLHLHIENLSLKEHNSFEIEELNAHATICAQALILDELYLKTPHSELRDYFAFFYTHWRDFKDFNNSITMKANLQKSRLSFVDLREFSDQLAGWDQVFILNGKAEGVLSNMKSPGLELRYGEKTVLNGSLSLRGLPDIDNTYIDLDAKNASSNADEIGEIMRLEELPEELDRLGDIRFRGRFTGFLHDFVAYGNFNTALGFVHSDINMKLKDKEEFSGTLETQGFDLGELLAVEELGKVSFAGSVKGSGFEFETMEARVEATMSQLELAGYNYQNIKVNGLLREQFFEGAMEVKDPNLEMTFNGKASLGLEAPEFDFVSEIYYADIAKLGWAPDFPARAKGNLVMDFTATSLDDFMGNIEMRHVELVKGDKRFFLDSLILVSSIYPNYRRITVQGDLLDAEIEGNFQPSQLDKSFNNFLAQLLPNTLKLKRVPLTSQVFTFEANLKRTRELTELFYPNVWVEDGTLSGSFNSNTSELALDAGIGRIHYEDFEIHGFRILADSSVGDRSFSIEAGASQIFQGDSALAHGVSLDFEVLKNRVDFDVSGYSDVYRATADLHGAFNFADSGIAVTFDPSYIQIDTLKWRIRDNSKLSLERNSVVRFDNFYLYSGEQQLGLTGELEGTENDYLYVFVEEFDLSSLNPILFPKNESELHGVANGRIDIVSFKGTLPLFTSNLEIRDLAVATDTMGDLSLKASVPKGYELINVNGVLENGLVKHLGISGFIRTARDNPSYNLKVRMDSTPLQLFQPMLSGLVSELGGTGKGELDITGNLEKPTIKGKFFLNDAGMKVDYLNTHYRFNSVVTINSQRLDLGRFKIIDERGNSGFCSGYISHDYFSDFDLNIELSDLKNFLCLNTTIEENELYYGTAIVSGSARFTGTPDALKIDVQARAERGSAFYVPLENYGGSSELEFIRFVNFDDYSGSEPYQDLSGIEMNFDLELTPATEIQLIFDSKMGDIIRARGYADLNLSINSKGDFKMYGAYEIEEGDYLFTAINLINKKFIIEKGGTIVWNGDPMKANMNLDAVYRTKASPENLVAGLVSAEDLLPYRQRIDVEAVMSLRGELTKPEIRFGFRLPNLSTLSASGVNTNTLKTVIRRIESDQEEMTRQVFSLLVVNNFMRPAINQGFASGAGGVEDGLLSSSVGDLLSNQISNWLGQLNSNWNVGVNTIIGGEQSDMLVNASRTFFDDRLEIEGTIGTASSFYNNINASYVVTEDGRLRVSAFNRTGNQQSIDPNNPSGTSLNRNINTQGLGLSYHIEFDILGPERREVRKKLREAKKEEENQ